MGDETRTAAEAGWRESRYNVSAAVPGTGRLAVANVYKGTLVELGPLERYLLSIFGSLPETHPIIGRFARTGILVDFDERAALEASARMGCAAPRTVSLTLCPTMACNFDCPYCFMRHDSRTMGPDVQDDVVALAGRMLEASRASELGVTWFGGEPLLAADIIQSLSVRLRELADECGAAYHAAIVTNGYLLTQEVADMLGEAGVRIAEITLDGMEATHDATRCLAGGGPTFARIVENLRNNKIPFVVKLRQNVHAGNVGEAERVMDLARRLAEESGSLVFPNPQPVLGSDAADERGRQVGLLDARGALGVLRLHEGNALGRGTGHHCNAQTIWDVAVDADGRLYQCYETASDASLSFGSAHVWDPADPIATADAPDQLTRYLNSSLPIGDEECVGCIWLPQCQGGCPMRRMAGERQCVPYKDEREAYVLELVARRASAGPR